MRTIPQRIKNLLLNRDYKALRKKVLVYRRYWDATAQQYALETTGLDLSHEVVSWGKLKWKLDTDEVNKWDVSNITLKFKNDKNQFKEGKDGSYFPGNYLIYGSKCEVYIGLPATNEWVRLFTGYLTDSPTYRPDTYQVDIRALSQMDWLKHIDAETVSQTATNEQLTLSPDDNADKLKYQTSKFGVGRFKDVRKGTTLATATKLLEKEDFEIQNLNEAALPAIIELKAPLQTGEKIWATYIYWYQNQTIADLLNKVLDAAGIPNENRQIEPIVFDNQVQNFADLSNGRGFIYSPSGNNYTLQDWAYKPYSGNMDWMVVETQNSIARINYGFKNSGTWRILSYLYPRGIVVYEDYEEIAGQNKYRGKGNYFSFNYLGFYINDNPALSIPFASQVQIDANGLIKGWTIDSSGKATLVGTLNFKFNNFKLEANSNMPYLYSPILTEGAPLNSNDISVFKSPGYMSDVISGSGFISAWGAITATMAPIGVAPTYKLYYRDSDNGTTFGNWISWDLGVNIPSSKQYLQFKIEITSPYYNGFNINNLQLTYYTNNIFIQLADLSGMSVYDVIVELAKVTTYETGFDNDGNFFFRPRDIAGAVSKTLTDSQIKEISQVQEDLDRLATKIIVTFGEYQVVSDAQTMGEAHPTNADKYGTRIKEIDSPKLLPADNVNLAYAVAPTHYKEFSKLRKIIRLKTSLDLEVELSDKVGIQHNNSLIALPQYTDYTKYNDLLTYFIACKIEGLEIDLEKHEVTIELRDYTADIDKPQPQTPEFDYDIAGEWTAKK